MDYCLDTSVYTQAHRTYYAFDLAPGFWIALKQHAERKVLISPISVYTELAKGNDELAKWAKENKGILFVEPDDKVIDAFRQIVDFSNSYYDDEHWVREFLSGADPWVIAQAKAHNLVVVTMEGKKGSEEINPKSKRFRGKLKIPNMCGHFEVKCNSTYELVRALKIGLG
jgi:hypothetical protein